MKFNQPKLTHERLCQALSYNKKTGLFTWKINTSGKLSKGKTAGSPRSDGYVFIGLDREKFRAARLAWFYVKGVWPKCFVDHENGITGDNRWKNLREADQYKNQQNKRANRYTGNPYKGIYWSKGARKWAATIRLAGKEKYLGLFYEAKEAAIAYDIAAVSHFGRFARLNFPGAAHAGC